LAGSITTTEAESEIDILNSKDKPEVELEVPAVRPNKLRRMTKHIAS
jgi:hypothetical protein